MSDSHGGRRGLAAGYRAADSDFQVVHFFSFRKNNDEQHETRYLRVLISAATVSYRIETGHFSLVYFENAV